MKNRIFEDLFVLELANNHWGKLQRGLQIIDTFAEVVKRHNIKAAIKLQFRDVDTFIHKDFRNLTDYRYITKTLATKMSKADYITMVEAVRNHGLITMATPFDEISVDLCCDAGIDIIKIASSDINDYVLINKIAKTKKPVIVSTGGACLEDVVSVAKFFNEKHIPLAINHCVAQYPTEKENLDMAQIDLLKNLFPDNVIGFSTHERNEDIGDAMIMAYAKGARTFERHIDIPNSEKGVSPYCSLPEDLEHWITAYKKAVAMNGEATTCRRDIPLKETKYLDALVRGVYAKKNLKQGSVLTFDDVYFAIPVQKGQLSCREFKTGEVLQKDVIADKPLDIYNTKAEYLTEDVVLMLKNRGL